MLAQDGELFRMLTVRETLEFAFGTRGHGAAARRELAEASLRKLGFLGVAERRVGDGRGSGAAISGGERRRLCVAAELALARGAGREKGASMSLQLENLAMKCVKESVHSLRTQREMISRPKMSRNE